MILCLFQQKVRQRLGGLVQCVELAHRIGCRRIVAREKSRLQFSDPVEEFHKYRWEATCRTLLEGTLRKAVVIKGAEPPRLSAEHPEERKQWRHSVEEEAELPHEFQQVFGLQL